MDILFGFRLLHSRNKIYSMCRIAKNEMKFQNCRKKEQYKIVEMLKIYTLKITNWLRKWIVNSPLFLAYIFLVCWGTVHKYVTEFMNDPEIYPNFNVFFFFFIIYLLVKFIQRDDFPFELGMFAGALQSQVRRSFYCPWLSEFH